MTGSSDLADTYAEQGLAALAPHYARIAVELTRIRTASAKDRTEACVAAPRPANGSATIIRRSLV